MLQHQLSDTRIAALLVFQTSPIITMMFATPRLDTVTFANDDDNKKSNQKALIVGDGALNWAAAMEPSYDEVGPPLIDNDSHTI